jgi:hypothetical protein
MIQKIMMTTNDKEDANKKDKESNKQDDSPQQLLPEKKFSKKLLN